MPRARQRPLRHAAPGQPAGPRQHRVEHPRCSTATSTGIAANAHQYAAEHRRRRHRQGAGRHRQPGGHRHPERDDRGRRRPPGRDMVVAPELDLRQQRPHRAGQVLPELGEEEDAGRRRQRQPGPEVRQQRPPRQHRQHARRDHQHGRQQDRQRPSRPSDAGDPVPLGHHRRQARLRRPRGAAPAGPPGVPGPAAGTPREAQRIRALDRVRPGRDTAAGRQPVRILAFGTYDVRTHPRVRRAHRRPARLRRRGRRGQRPARHRHRRPGRDAAPALAAAAAGVPAGPVLGGAGRRAGAGPGAGTAPDAVLVGYLGHFDVLLARLLFRRTPIVLDHLIFAADTARDRGVARRLEGAAAARGWTGAALRRGRRGRRGHRGARRAGARRPGRPGGRGAGRRAAGVVRRRGRGRPRPPPGAPLRVVFFGLFTPLQGTPAIGARARPAGRRHRGSRVTMVGAGQDRAETRRLAAGEPAGRWRDWVPADGAARAGRRARRLPGHLRHRTQGRAGGAQQGLPGGRRRVRGRHLGHPAAAGGARRRGQLRAARRRRGAGRRPARAGRRPGRGREAARGGPGPGPGAVRRHGGRRYRSANASPSSARGAAPDDRTGHRARPRWPRAPGCATTSSAAARRAAPGDVLEIGCGQGAMGARLARRARYLGVEPDPASCAVAAARVTGGRRRRSCTATTPPFRPARPTTWSARSRCSSTSRTTRTALAEWVGSSGRAGICCSRCRRSAAGSARWTSRVGHYRRYDPDELVARLLRAPG